MKSYLLYPFICLALAACGGEKPPYMAPSTVQPKIFPDYINVTIPAQIAPMNFNIDDKNADYVYVKVTGDRGGEMEASGEWADFDEKQWHQLTARNVGQISYSM